ncbi:MAG: chemotaxis protein CheW [Planctomycetota bacterium]
MPDPTETTNASIADGATIDGANGADQLQFVTFEVAGEEFAVDILSVHEINRMIDLTRVPQSPPEVEGVINLRGKIIPVIDLRRRFSMPEAERNEHSRIIVVEVHGRVIGFIVDRVHEVLRISPSIVEAAPPMVGSIDSDFISGVGKLDDRLLIMLDLERLFTANSIDAIDTSVAA